MKEDLVTMNTNGREFRVNKHLSSGEMLNIYVQRFNLEKPIFTMHVTNDNHTPLRLFAVTLKVDGQEVKASGTSKKIAKSEAAKKFINNIFHSGGSTPLYGKEVSAVTVNKVSPAKELQNIGKMSRFMMMKDEKAYRAGNYGVRNDTDETDGFDIYLKPRFWQSYLLKAKEIKLRRLLKMKFYSGPLDTIIEEDEDIEDIYAPVRPLTAHTLPPIPAAGPGRIITLDTPLTLTRVLGITKEHLSMDHIRLAVANGVNMHSIVKTIAVCVGSGGSVLGGVKTDLVITGEMSHHEVLDFVNKGVSVILADHFNTERGYLKIAREKLQTVLQRGEDGHL